MKRSDESGKWISWFLRINLCILIVWTSHPKFLLKKCHLKLTKKYTGASQQSWGTKVPVPAASLSLWSSKKRTREEVRENNNRGWRDTPLEFDGFGIDFCKKILVLLRIWETLCIFATEIIKNGTNSIWTWFVGRSTGLPEILIKGDPG